MKHRMTKHTRTALILTIVVAVALLSAVWAPTFEPRPSPWELRPWPQFEKIRGDLELFYTIKTVISSVNVTLLVFLFLTYINIYEKTQSEFTIGLIIFSMVLLFYALVSNPIVQFAFGYRAFGLGPFAMLPDLFTLIALAILLYLTLKY